ncbi:MAG: hypothetical protein LKE53_06475 [Oscillospiraceae bacterium]|jgi:hypothetical protein|nr:hypothetical protein [Oscillospiraceae bacterium]
MELIIRDVKTETLLTLDQQAKAAGISRNRYLNRLLNATAQNRAADTYNREILDPFLREVIIPVINQNTAALNNFSKWYQDMKDTLAEGEDEP